MVGRYDQETSFFNVKIHKKRRTRSQVEFARLTLVWYVVTAFFLFSLPVLAFDLTQKRVGHTP